MKRCAVKPYEGKDRYIFASYCHKDKAYVFPVIEQLAKDGYRVWYDEGIDPGSEWPEIIADHLNGCAVCIAFITQNSLNSHNCRREINFALLKKKFFISVILEPVEMSLGMEMQLSAAQSIFKYTLSTEAEFFSKLYTARDMKLCMGSPNASIIVSSPQDYAEELRSFDKVREPFSDKWFINDRPVTPDPDPRQADAQSAEAERRAAEEKARREAAEAERRAAEEKARREAAEAERRAAEERARREAARNVHVLRREKTNELIQITKEQFTLGRSDTKADYVITDNHSISRAHATLFVDGEKCYIVDNHSLNKTYLNGYELNPDVRYEVHNGDSIRIANENLVYLKW